MEKPKKTDCIAMCGYGWGYAREGCDAIVQMLRHVPMNYLEELKRQKKKLEIKIYECSEDWAVHDMGSVQASYIADFGTAMLDPTLALKAKDVREDLQESIDYADEA